MKEEPDKVVDMTCTRLLLQISDMAKVLAYADGDYLRFWLVEIEPEPPFTIPTRTFTMALGHSAGRRLTVFQVPDEAPEKRQILDRYVEECRRDGHPEPKIVTLTRKRLKALRERIARDLGELRMLRHTRKGQIDWISLGRSAL